MRGIVEFDVTDNLEVSLKAEHGDFDVVGRNVEIYNEEPSISPNPAFAGKTYAEILYLIGAMNPADAVVVDPSVLNNVKDGKRSSNDDFSNNKSEHLCPDGGLGDGHRHGHVDQRLSKFKYDELCDCDFTGAVVFNVDLEEKYEQFSQEIRLVSDTDAASSTISSAPTTSTSDHDYADNINVPANSVLVPVVNMQAPANGTLIANTRAARDRERSRATSYSAFAQLTYHFTDQLRLTLGGRVTHEKKDGERTLTIQQLDGSALTGMQAIVAPLVYAQLVQDQLDQPRRTIAGHADPAGPAMAQRRCCAALGTHPVDGKISKTGFVPSVRRPV